MTRHAKIEPVSTVADLGELPTDPTPVLARGLSVRNLTRQFHGIYAVNGVSLDCRVGQIVGLIGPNGAGKTTLMNIISGTIAPSSGQIFLNGTELTASTPAACAAAGIARTFQNIRLFKGLTVRQNIEVAAISRARIDDADRAQPATDALIELMGLGSIADAKAGTLSYGYQRRVEIARALALGPDIVLLDEPAAGMNEQESAALIGSVRKLRDEFGCGVVVIDHDLHFILSVSEVLYVMHLGAIIVSGAPAEVRKDERVIEIYLGRKSGQ